ncbi:MAG: hypothetical protein VX777_09200 [Chlamydiota bacterium]|nr:hypothetical protein [Chlamydiota bacterium]
MKKIDLKKLAVMGIASGALLASQSGEAVNYTQSSGQGTYLAGGQGCGGSSGCGGKSHGSDMNNRANGNGNGSYDYNNGSRTNDSANGTNYYENKDNSNSGSHCGGKSSCGGKKGNMDDKDSMNDTDHMNDQDQKMDSQSLPRPSYPESYSSQSRSEHFSPRTIKHNDNPSKAMNNSSYNNTTRNRYYR